MEDPPSHVIADSKGCIPVGVDCPLCEKVFVDQVCIHHTGYLGFHINVLVLGLCDHLRNSELVSSILSLGLLNDHICSGLVPRALYINTRVCQ